MKTIDACNDKAKAMKVRYKELQDRKAELKAELEKIELEELYFREEEVKNVLDYVRTYSKLGVLDSNDIDTYLCHCQNMLKGNIDGIFLTFHKE
jgi:hypothetical protein